MINSLGCLLYKPGEAFPMMIRSAHTTLRFGQNRNPHLDLTTKIERKPWNGKPPEVHEPLTQVQEVAATLAQQVAKDPAATSEQVNAAADMLAEANTKWLDMMGG
jgi:hypothetical protein